MAPKLKNLDQMRRDAADIYYSSIAAVEAGAAVKRHIRLDGSCLKAAGKTYDLSGYQRLFVIGAGKATAPMAGVLETLLGDWNPEGVITVKYAHGLNLKSVEIVEGGHPLPDENGLKGAKRILNIARQAGREDLVICLFSGGGSALLPLPVPGVSLTDKQDLIARLLSCGATIHEINALRKHLSMIKGGRLAESVFPADLITLILSDVVGDDLDVIASGPTVPDTSTFSDCHKILEKYDLKSTVPDSVISHIDKGLTGQIEETPKSGAAFFNSTCNIVIGSNTDALAAAKRTAEKLGYHTLILSTQIEGDTTQAAKLHGAVAREILKSGNPLPVPACFLSGGETTVNVTGNGRGGRNMEFALAAALETAGADNIVVLCAGTDGTDGPTEAAGAISDSHTVQKAAVMGMNAENMLADNDSYHFFKDLGDLFVTGPTRTNVMDVRIFLVA